MFATSFVAVPVLTYQGWVVGSQRPCSFVFDLTASTFRILACQTVCGVIAIRVRRKIIVHGFPFFTALALLAILAIPSESKHKLSRSMAVRVWHV